MWGLYFLSDFNRLKNGWALWDAPSDVVTHAYDPSTGDYPRLGIANLAFAEPAQINTNPEESRSLIQ
jgi:hypothetical protein